MGSGSRDYKWPCVAVNLLYSTVDGQHWLCNTAWPLDATLGPMNSLFMRRFMRPAMLTLLAIPLLFCGCNTTRFSRTETWLDPQRGPVTNVVSVMNRRAIWSTESYTATLGTNTASLTATKSSTDQETIQILVQALISLATKTP